MKRKSTRIKLLYISFFFLFLSACSSNKWYVWRADNLSKKGKNSEAELLYLKALKTDSENTEILLKLGWCYYRQRKVDESMKICDKIFALTDTSKEMLVNGSVSQLRLFSKIEINKYKFFENIFTQKNPTADKAKNSNQLSDEIVRDYEEQMRKEIQEETSRMIRQQLDEDWAHIKWMQEDAKYREQVYNRNLENFRHERELYERNRK